MKLKTALAVPALIALAALNVAMMKDPIVGKWKITAEQDGGGKTLNYELVFKGQQLTVTELEKKGWKPVPYEDDIRVGGVGTWTATLKHDTEGEMKFSGTVTGGEMKGNIVVKKPNAKEVNYTFTGER